VHVGKVSSRRRPRMRISRPGALAWSTTNTDSPAWAEHICLRPLPLKITSNHICMVPPFAERGRSVK